MSASAARPSGVPEGLSDGARLEAGDLAPDPRPAPPLRRVLAQAGFDARVLLGNGEQLLLTLVLPALLLAGLTLTSVPDLGPGPRIDAVAPGVLALAVLSTAFTGQAIGTAFDRRYGVLRLLGTTPLGRSGLLAGRALAVLVIEAVQVAVFGGIALLLGWRPVPSGLPRAAVALLLGTVAFVALGLLLAGTLRSEAVLAAANLVWVLLVAGGGIVVPVHGPLGSVAAVLPSGALGAASRAALQQGRLDVGALAVLLAWAAGAALAAVRWFRWD
jgi:ABC-2 type transport system permease protein